MSKASHSRKNPVLAELKAANRIITRLSRLARYYAGGNGVKVGPGRWDFPPLRRQERKAAIKQAEKIR